MSIAFTEKPRKQVYLNYTKTPEPGLYWFAGMIEGASDAAVTVPIQVMNPFTVEIMGTHYSTTLSAMDGEFYGPFDPVQGFGDDLE